MKCKINRDKLFCAQQEIMELQRLLIEAKERERKILKDSGMQSWWDYVCEVLGF